jgi:hypothetical protein
MVGKNRIETETYVILTYEVISACESKSGDRILVTDVTR